MPPLRYGIDPIDAAYKNSLVGLEHVRRRQESILEGLGSLLDDGHGHF